MEDDIKIKLQSIKAIGVSNDASVNKIITAAGKNKFNNKMHKMKYRNGLLFINTKIFSSKLMKVIF